MLAFSAGVVGRRSPSTAVAAHRPWAGRARTDAEPPPRPGAPRPGRRPPRARPRAPGAVLVDATLGLGGHTEAVLDAVARRPASIGIDRDPHALALAGERLAPFGERVTFVHAVYDEIPDVLADLGLAARRRRPLRPRRLLHAARRPRARLRLRRGRAARHADGRHHRPHRGRRAQHLPGRPSWPGSCASTARSGSPGGSPTGRRASASASPSPPPRGSSSCVRRDPGAARRTGGHPAKRTFQALRIEVNDELAVLRRALPAAIDAIGVGGRVVVMSYHSLEDRLAKQAFAAGDPQRRAAGPAGRPRGPRADAPLLTRGAEKAVERRGRPTTPAPPRCGCARDERDPRRSRRMSTPAGRHSRPRSASHADRRGRRRAGPAHRRPAGVPRRAPPRVPFVILVSLLLLGGVVGLLLFNTSHAAGLVHRHRPGAAGRRPAAREQTLQMELDASATRSVVAERAQRAGHGAGGTPAFLGRRRHGARRSRCRRTRPTGAPILPPGAAEAGRPRPRADHRRRPARRARGRPHDGRATRAAPSRRDAARRDTDMAPPGPTRQTASSRRARDGPPATRAAGARPHRGRAAPRDRPRGTPMLRLRFGFLLIAMVLSVFAVRLVQLQGIDAEAYAAMAAAEGAVRGRAAGRPRRDPRPQRRRAGRLGRRLMIVADPKHDRATTPARSRRSSPTRLGSTTSRPSSGCAPAGHPVRYLARRVPSTHADRGARRGRGAAATRA